MDRQKQLLHLADRIESFARESMGLMLDCPDPEAAASVFNQLLRARIFVRHAANAYRAAEERADCCGSGSPRP